MSDTVQNGKGSKPRPYKVQTYADNFDQIDWSKGRKKKTVELTDGQIAGMERKDREFWEGIKDAEEDKTSKD